MSLIFLFMGFILAQSIPSVERGEVLAGLGSCKACHTVHEEQMFAGGYAIETSFGTFYGPNITPDKTHGIGNWSYKDFERAMRKGKSPKNYPYWPAFPYTSTTKWSNVDLLSLWMYLQEQTPIATPNKPHDLEKPYRKRTLLPLWRLLAFNAGEIHPKKRKSDSWNLGAYLVEGPGHCGECHTPRNRIGKLIASKAFTGTDLPPEPSPNITSSNFEISKWNKQDWVFFLETGMLPNGDFVGGEMMRLIDIGTSKLTEKERAAIAEYMMELP